MIVRSELVKKTIKTLAKIATAAAIYCGTYRNNSGFPLIYNYITQDSAGICVGLYNRIGDGVSYTGMPLGFVNRNDGQIDGISAALFDNRNSGRINGINLALLANKAIGKYSEVNGIEAAILGSGAGTKEDLNSATRGIQIGLLNGNRTPEDCVTLGFNTFNDYNGALK